MRLAQAPAHRPANVTGARVDPPVTATAEPRLLWWRIPASSLLYAPSFRALISMRVAAETAVNALTFGMLIQVARRYAEEPRAVGILSALVTVATVAPAALLGPVGGVVVDRAPKRLMLVVANLLRALLCVAFLVLGTGTAAIYALLVAITAVTQFATPAEAAVVPRVVPPERLTAANSYSNLAESSGALLGTAILAPVMVKLFRELEPLILVCAVLLGYAALRAVAIHLMVPEQPAPPGIDSSRKPWLAGTRESLVEAWRWLAADRSAFISMLLLVLASTANLVMVTLAPRFTKQALGVEPEFAVFVFGPAVVGVLTGLAATPWLARRVNKRLLVTGGFLLMVAVLLLLGAIDPVTAVLKRVGPLGWLLSNGPLSFRDGRLGTALLLAAPLGFGLSMVQVAANTLLHERVPLALQGRVFALQGAVKNATAIVPLLLLGGLASLLGDVRPVLIVTALLVLSLALYGAAHSAQWSGARAAHRPPAEDPTAGSSAAPGPAPRQGG
jgi:MFS family permease